MSLEQHRLSPYIHVDDDFSLANDKPGTRTIPPTFSSDIPSQFTLKFSQGHINPSSI